MAWYDDKKKKIHIVTYKSDKDASKEANMAAEKGWVIQDSSSKNRGWNIWTGPIGSGKQRITVTYIRVEPTEVNKNKKIYPAEDTISQADTKLKVQGTDNVISQLEKLSQLKDKGVLTEEEFQAQKKKILGM